MGAVGRGEWMARAGDDLGTCLDRARVGPIELGPGSDRAQTPFFLKYLSLSSIRSPKNFFELGSDRHIAQPSPTRPTSNPTLIFSTCL